MREFIKSSILGFIFLILFLFRDYLFDVITLFNVQKETTDNLEVEVLRSQNDYLRTEMAKTADLNNLIIDTKYEYILSKVSIRNPYSFYDTLIINNGTNDNIEEKMAVVNENGLIGIVSKTNKNSSNIKLITASTNEISVIIHGFYGILSGYSKEDGLIIVSNMNNYDGVEENDLVYTSGLGGLPSGILIGKVESISHDRFGIEQNIYIRSKVDFDNINYVGVILSKVEE